MRILELFSGTQSVSKVCRAQGHETLSIDIDGEHTPDLQMDILAFDETTHPRDRFQFIWASPPCESYSQARSSALVEREAAMLRADALVGKTLKILEWFHEAEWAVENPASSRLWKRTVASELAKKSWVTSYCAFGYNYRKNTRISCSKPLKLPVCGGVGVCPAMVGSSHLEHAQQGHRGRHKEHAQKGGGGTLNVYHTRNQLHSIPPGLIELILSQVFPTARPSSVVCP